MNRINTLLGIALGTVMIGACAFAETTVSDKTPKEKPAPSWDALADHAKELAMARYSTEDLQAQLDKKTEHLRRLYEQRAAQEAQIVHIITATRKSLDEISAIDDPVLRDESLLRFRASKDIRMKTVRAKLNAVNEMIERENRELALLQRLLQSRRAEARLYGRDPAPAGGSYVAYLSSEAKRVRAEEEGMLKRIRDAQVAQMEDVVLPLVGPRMLTFTEAVMASVVE